MSEWVKKTKVQKVKSFAALRELYGDVPVPSNPWPEPKGIRREHHAPKPSKTIPEKSESTPKDD